jgi:hypothetical protein
MPPPQLGWAKAVVGEEEVFNRVLDSAPAAIQMATDEMVDSPLVRSLPGWPLGLAEDGKGKHVGHRTSVGAVTRVEPVSARPLAATVVEAYRAANPDRDLSQPGS